MLDADAGEPDAACSSGRMPSSPDWDFGIRCVTIWGGSLQPTSKTRMATPLATMIFTFEEIDFLLIGKSTIKRRLECRWKSE